MKELTLKQKKGLFWLLKILSIVISCAPPIFAICEKFPLWNERVGTERTVGSGIILIGMVLVIIFRRTVFDFLRDRLDLKHAPPLLIWLVLLLASYVLVYLGELMRDLTTIFWMGLLGCAIGTVITYFANKLIKEQAKEG
jgi:drug/metabolite transporter (DMT)-like permease